MATLAEKLAAKKAAAASQPVVSNEQLEKKADEAVAVHSTVEEGAKVNEPVKVVELKTVAEAIKEAPKQSVPTVLSEPTSTDDIIPRIRELAALSGEDLTNAMKELKAALMKNPAAVENMLPEDIGEMVSNLRRMTGQEIVVATAKKPKEAKAAKQKALTPEELAAAFDEL